MGNFYRKGNVVFKGPSTQNLEYQTIANFKGLHMTDNPFIADISAPSDVLNLYIDESNKLVTRPRLEISYKIDGYDEYVDVLRLKDSTVFLVKDDDVIKMFIVDDDTGTISNISCVYNIVGEKLKHFYKDDILYFFDIIEVDDKRKMGYIDGNELKLFTDYYIPNVFNLVTETSSGNEDEELNIMTNKYTETWRWDGSWAIEENGEKGKFVSETISKFKFKEEYVENTRYFFKKGYVVYENNLVKCYDYSDNLMRTFDVSGSSFSLSDYTKWTVSDDFTCLFWVSSNFSNRSLDVNLRSTKGNNNDVYDYANALNMSMFDSISVHISENNVCCMVFPKLQNEFLKTTNILLWFYKYNPLTNTYVKDLYTTPAGVIADYGNSIKIRNLRTTISNDGNSMFLSYYDDMEENNEIQYYLLRDILTESKMDAVFLEQSNSFFYNYVGIYNDTLLIRRSTTFYIYLNIYNVINRQPYTILNNNDSCISFEEDVVWTLNGDSVYYISDATSDKPKRSFFKDSDVSNFVNLSKIKAIYSDDKEYYIVSEKEENYYYTTDVKIDFNSPLSIVKFEKELSEKDDLYNKWSIAYNSKKKADIVTKFMNNYWIASDNILRSSLYNNPFYFPMSKYNEFSENITGFNRLGDSLIAIYSEKGIQLQNPIQSEDGSFVLTSTEMKSQKGNIAFDNTIITPYTNIPVQISDDGFYGLRLEENVQSEERQTVLLTEDIYKKLSKETMSDCKVFNYKYWTLFSFIDNEQTNIYILDNRTISWFYWECPIKILKMFVKDNKLYVVDYSGVVYSFEEQDFIKDTSIKNSITVYGDELKSGELITIPWLWKSQILTLGSISNLKKLLTTSFIVLDDDVADTYGLNYKFKAFKKHYTTDTSESLLQGDINYIKNVTIRTYISSFNFLQIELSNPTDISNASFDENDSNKLNLVAILFKYQLLNRGF